MGRTRESSWPQTSRRWATSPQFPHWTSGDSPTTAASTIARVGTAHLSGATDHRYHGTECLFVSFRNNLVPTQTQNHWWLMWKGFATLTTLCGARYWVGSRRSACAGCTRVTYLKEENERVICKVKSLDQTKIEEAKASWSWRLFFLQLLGGNFHHEALLTSEPTRIHYAKHYHEPREWIRGKYSTFQTVSVQGTFVWRALLNSISMSCCDVYIKCSDTSCFYMNSCNLDCVSLSQKYHQSKLFRVTSQGQKSKWRIVLIFAISHTHAH